MTRPLIISALQMGPTQRADSRRHTLARMITLLERASRDDASLVVFPELTLSIACSAALLDRIPAVVPVATTD